MPCIWFLNIYLLQRKKLGKLRILIAELGHSSLGPIHLRCFSSGLPRRNMSVPKSNSMYVVCRIIWLQNLIDGRLDDSSRWLKPSFHQTKHCPEPANLGKEETKQKASKTSLEIFWPYNPRFRRSVSDLYPNMRYPEPVRKMKCPPSIFNITRSWHWGQFVKEIHQTMGQSVLEWKTRKRTHQQMICFKHHQLQSPTFLSFTQRANLSIPFLTSVSEGTHPVFLQGAVHCRPNACSRACWPPGSGRTSNQCLHFNPPRKTKLPETRHLFILLWILLFAKIKRFGGNLPDFQLKQKTSVCFSSQATVWYLHLEGMDLNCYPQWIVWPLRCFGSIFCCGQKGWYPAGVKPQGLGEDLKSTRNGKFHVKGAFEVI